MSAAQVRVLFPSTCARNLWWRTTSLESACQKEMLASLLRETPSTRGVRPAPPPRESYELAERRDAGVLVRLLWSGEEDGVHVEYLDLRTGEAFRAPVPGEKALEAFRHPNAYRVAAGA
jgi:hypothetical protein